MTICKECRGLGLIMQKKRLASGVVVLDEVQCPTCKGDGEVEAEVRIEPPNVQGPSGNDNQ